MTRTTGYERPGGRHPSRRRRAVQAASIALVAGLVGGGIALGVDHAIVLTASSGTPSSSSAQSTPAGTGSSSAGSSGGTLGPTTGGGFGGGNSGTYPGGFSGSGSSSSGSAASSPTPGAGAPSDVSGIAAKVAPALVDVNSTFNYQNAAGAGTGVVVSSDGEVITNNHVVNGATSISVTDVGNGKTYRAVSSAMTPRMTSRCSSCRGRPD